MRVQRAYIGSERVLVDSYGRVFRGGMWVPVDGEIIREGERYERWVDVPFAWIGCVPYWR
jgi:hypothetical protein